MVAAVGLLGLTPTSPVSAAGEPSSEADGFSLSADASISGDLSLTGPDQAAPGDIVELVVTAPSGAAAFEGALQFDQAALEFGGIYPSDDQTSVRMATDQSGGVSLLAFRCLDDSCDSGLATDLGSLTARFVVVEPGVHSVRLARSLFVTSDGTTFVSPSTEMTITVAGSDTQTSGSDVAPLSTSRQLIIPGAVSGDVSGEGRVSGMDVAETTLTWADLRRQGQPCALDTERLQRADLDGSGCIDAADLVAVAAAVAASPVESILVDPEVAVTADRAATGDRALDAAADADVTVAADVAAQADPTPMVVNSTSDEFDANLNNGVCDTPSGVCSLRAAILQANANFGPDIIHFNIPGSGPHLINLGDSLPTINDTTGPVYIDGYTQPGASVNTSDRLSNADIRIEIVGPGDITGVSMQITSADNTIRGLSMYRSFWNIHLTGSASIGNRIVGNFIGTNAAATVDPNSGATDQAGIEIGSRASENRIGTVALADRNVISGNYYSGVRVNHAGTKGNRIQNNLIGLRPNGSDSLFTRIAGVDVQWGAEETLIGGYQQHAGNVITGVDRYGIDLSHSSKNNIVVGNFLGTDASGNQAPTHAANDVGIAIKDNTVGNTIEQNVIGGNRLFGVWHRHNFTGVNYFRYNRLGVGLNGGDVGGRGVGVHLTGHDTTYDSNIVANHADDGIQITNFNGGNGFSSPEYTQRNTLTKNSFFDNADDVDLRDGSNNNIGRPSISNSGNGFASGSACGNCRVELYVADGNEGRQYLASTTASSNGSWSISDSRISNVRLRAQATSNNKDSSEFSSTTTVGNPSDSSAPTIAAIADEDGLQYGLKSIPVNANDLDGNPLSYSAIGLPSGVDIDAVTGVISGRPGSVGNHVVNVRVDDGTRTAHQTFNWTVTEVNIAPVLTAPTGSTVIDDFETDQGWQRNPAGTDNATTGLWEVGVLQASPSNGGRTYQLGNTPSGSSALSTGRLGGSSVGTHDIDNGVTTIRSPQLTLPADATAVTFQHYFAYLDNATDADFFTTTIIDQNGNRTIGYSQEGSSSLKPANWAEASFDATPWAGQTIRIEFAAADNGSASLIEAAVDDLTILSPSAIGTVGDVVRLPITGTDANGDPLTYSATGLPDELSISSAGIISGRLVQAGSYSVSVTASDPQGLQDTIEFGWTVAPATGRTTGSIGGRVIAAGDGVAGVNVDLFNENRVSYLSSTLSDGSGNYFFADLQPGCYVATAVAPAGSEFVTGTYANRDICVAAGEDLTVAPVVVVTPGGSDTAIGGTVLDGSGAPVSGLSADLFTADVDGNRITYQRSAQTDGNGAYRFDLAEAGCYAVVLIAPVDETFEGDDGFAERATCVTNGQQVLDLNARLSGETPGDSVISGFITDAGNPVANAQADLFVANADGSRGQFLGAATTDQTGEYSFETEAGCYILVLIAPTGRTFQTGSGYFQGAGCVTAEQPLVISAQLL
ncbi:MAG: putative Ig domain-containing protein [Acidimicrobiales bacterium]